MTRLKKKPRISVIIPTHNRGWIIKDAIESVLNQTFSDYELIVVDDGSTDHTPHILKGYGEKIVVFRQKNQGVSAARNSGVAMAKGEYIAFLDSDDTWLPKKLSAQIDFFNRFPEAMICQTEEIWIRNGVRVNPKKLHKKRSGAIFEPSVALCLVSPSAVMMKRRLFESVGLFDETLFACEDYDMWLRVTWRYPIYLIDIPLIRKRGGHSDQLSRKWGLDKFRIKALKKIIDRRVLSTEQHLAAVKALRQKCTIYAGGCRKRGREDEAADYLRLLGRYKIDPTDTLDE